MVWHRAAWMAMRKPPPEHQPERGPRPSGRGQAGQTDSGAEGASVSWRESSRLQAGATHEAKLARWLPSDLQALAAGRERPRRSFAIGAHHGDADGEKNEGDRDDKDVGDDGNGRRAGQAEGRGRAQRPVLSLRGRALRFLSQREHSRFELARKLERFEPDTDVIAGLLDALEREGWLSSERFVESLLHRRSQGFGLRRIRQELAEHRLDGDEVEASLAALRESEFERAHALWLRRFGSAPGDLKERARQHRYLAARGFGNDVIAKVLRSDTL